VTVILGLKAVVPTIRCYIWTPKANNVLSKFYSFHVMCQPIMKSTSTTSHKTYSNVSANKSGVIACVVKG